MDVDAVRGRIDPRLLLVVGAFASWVFFEVSEEVIEGDSAAFDRSILLAMRSPGAAAESVKGAAV